MILLPMKRDMFALEIDFDVENGWNCLHTLIDNQYYKN